MKYIVGVAILIYHLHRHIAITHIGQINAGALTNIHYGNTVKGIAI